MLKPNIFFSFFCFLLFSSITSCNKDEVIKNGSINGTVFNLTTDKGIGGVQVFLTIIHDRRFGRDEITKLETLSNSDGGFSFSNLEINTGENYTYELATESESGEGNTYGIIGDERILDNNKIEDIHILKVIPTFKNLCFQLDTTVNIAVPDTIIVSFEQRIYHKNVPDLPYQSYRNTTYLQNGHLNCTFGNYPMGLWNITIDKTKNGYRSVIEDSIFIDWKETKTYMIKW